MDLPNELIHQILLYLSINGVVQCHLSSPIFHVLTENEMYRNAIEDPNLPHNCDTYAKFLGSYPETGIKLFTFFARYSASINDKLKKIIETNEKKLKREEGFWDLWSRN